MTGFALDGIGTMKPLIRMLRTQTHTKKMADAIRTDVLELLLFRYDLMNSKIDQKVRP